jgi:hypothetical protein
LVSELNKSLENNCEPSSDSEDDIDEPSPECDETLLFQQDDSLISRIVRIAPGEGKTPLSLLRDLEAQVLSFPSIYGATSRQFKQGLKVSYTDIVKSEMRRYDRRACTTANLLYSCKVLQTHRVANAISLCLRKKRGGQNVNVGQLKSTDGIDKLISHDDGYR